MTDSARRHRENPIGFKYLELSDEDDRVPFWKGYVAEYSGDYAVLGTVFPEGRDDEPYDKTGSFYRKPRAGNFMSKNHIGYHYDLRDVDDLERQGCEGLLSEFVDMHANAPYTITGRIFSEKPTYPSYDKNHEFPDYEVVREQKWTPKGVHSLEDAEKWLLENHPDYYMGSGIVQDCPSGDFAMLAVPGVEYPKGMYENMQNRRKYAQERADDFKIKLGPTEKQRVKNRKTPNVNYGTENEKDLSLE